MPSFDIVNKVDLQQLDNAVNVTKKEIQNRFDFRDSKTEVDLDKQGLKINLTTDNSMRIKTIEDILLQRAVKQNIDGKAFDFSKALCASQRRARAGEPCGTRARD